MKIGAYEMEKYFKGSYLQLWRELPGEDINDTRDLVEDFNDENYWRMPLPATSMVLLNNLSRWSKNRRVYRFSSELFHELGLMADEMQEDDKIPTEFLRLPFDAVALQIDDTEAFYKLKEQGMTFLDDSFGTNTSIIVTSTSAGDVHEIYPCLVGSMWSPMGSFCTMVLPIAETVGESIQAGIDFLHHGKHWIARDVQLTMARMLEENPGATTTDDMEISSLKYLIQMILYLNSSNADFSERPATRVERRERKKLEEKTGSKIIDVGYHVGRLIKSERKQETIDTGMGSRKRAHFRRAHWHHYWIGKHGEQTQILKWVPVAIIHEEEIDDKPTVMMVDKSTKG